MIIIILRSPPILMLYLKLYVQNKILITLKQSIQFFEVSKLSGAIGISDGRSLAPLIDDEF